jgi:hypothetical protein
VANLQLGQELSALRAVLEAEREQQSVLIERVGQLEQDLSAADREREFLIAEQDRFLAALLDEHEAALKARDGADETIRMSAEMGALAEQLVRAEARSLQAERAATEAREALEATQVERDLARGRAARYELERDELRAEASRLRASLGVHRPSTNPPPPVSSGRAPSFLPAPALRLDDGELDATLRGRSPTPLTPAVVPRFTPSQLGGMHAPPSLKQSQPPLRPVASEFPRESTRPGVGGPKPTDAPPPSFGPPPAAWTTPAPPPDTTITRSPWPVSAASLPPEAAQALPILKRKPDPTTRPLIDYSLGEGGVESETLEGAKLRSSKPPRK